MNKLTTAAVALGVSAIAVSVWFAMQTETQPAAPEMVQAQPEAHHDDHASHAGGIMDIEMSPELSTGVDMFVADSPSEKADEDWQGHEKDTIVWQVSEEGEAILKAEGHIPGDVVNEVYVELDVEELRTVEIGEFIDLYIPQIGGSYTGEVDFITEHENGDRTVEAAIPGAGKLFSAVITLGEDAVYGNLGTQADVFVMEGNGQYAWIASKSELIANHSKTHVDGIVPNPDQPGVSSGATISLDTPAQTPAEQPN